jgi:hypothetical protein
VIHLYLKPDAAAARHGRVRPTPGDGSRASGGRRGGARLDPVVRAARRRPPLSPLSLELHAPLHRLPISCSDDATRSARARGSNSPASTSFAGSAIPFCSAAPTLRTGDVHVGARGRANHANIHMWVWQPSCSRRRKARHGAQIKAARHSLEATSYAPLLRLASRLRAVRNARRHVS